MRPRSSLLWSVFVVDQSEKVVRWPNKDDQRRGRVVSAEVSQRDRNMQLLQLLQFAAMVCMLRGLQDGSRKRNEHHRKKRLRCDWGLLLSMRIQMAKKEAERRGLRDVKC